MLGSPPTLQGTAPAPVLLATLLCKEQPKKMAGEERKKTTVAGLQLEGKKVRPTTRGQGRMVVTLPTQADLEGGTRPVLPWLPRARGRSMVDVRRARLHQFLALNEYIQKL